MTCHIALTAPFGSVFTFSRPNRHFSSFLGPFFKHIGRLFSLADSSGDGQLQATGLESLLGFSGFPFELALLME